MNRRKIGESMAGITLIALVITIIVLLILAGVSIATLTGDNGLFTKASEAKIVTALGAVKEAINLEQVDKSMDKKEMTPETMLAEGKVARTVQAEGETYYMYYAIKPEAYEGMQGLGKGNLASLKDVFLIDDDLKVRYIASNGKEYGDNINNKILEDETKIRFASKAFSEYVSKISGATEEDMKFKWMKNQTSLTIEDSSIDSLEDLIFFPNLMTLNLNGLTLENLDGVENCIKLQNFRADYTIIKNYTKLSKLPVLSDFRIEYAKNMDFDNVIDSLKTVDTLTTFSIVGGIEVKNMARIDELTDNLVGITLRIAGIEKIEGLETKRNLKHLILATGQIKKIEGLDNCTKLESLELPLNKISKIEGLEKLTELNRLNLSSNQIIDILELDKNIKLTNLDLTNNPKIKSNRSEYTEEENARLDKIQEIITVRNGTIYMNAGQLGLFRGHEMLNLGGQNLTTLECLEGQTDLKILDLSNNKITLSDEKSQNILKNMSKLKALAIVNNPIETLSPINNIGSLYRLDVAGITNNLDLSEIEDIISQIEIARLKQEDVNSIVYCNSNKIVKLNFPESIFNTLPDLSKFTKLSTLIISGYGRSIDVSSISNLANLRKIDLTNINLTGKIPDFSKLTNLQSVNLQNNYLNSSDIVKLTALKNNTNLTIDLSNNSIIDASSLLELDTSCKIDLRNNVNLTQESKDTLKARFGNNVNF